MSRTAVSLADALPDVALHPLDDDMTVIGAYLAIKVADAEGTRWGHRIVGDLANPLELLGRLTAQVEVLTTLTADDFLYEDEDDAESEGEEETLDEPEEERVPIGELFPGMTITPLADGSVVQFVYAVIKFGYPEGDGWSYRTSARPNQEELLGVLSFECDRLRETARELVGQI